jgi:hypothetical protein
MPSDQTPRQPGATAGGASHQQTFQEGHDVDFSQALAGESGDPIWESYPPQAEAGRAERARRAVREPEGKLPAGRIIELDQHAGRARN